MAVDKNEIRVVMRARRKAVTPEARAAAGKELSRRLFVENRALGAAISAKGPIAVYLASKEEIDLSDFIAAALSFGCAVVAPRWNGTDYELVRLQDLATLVKGPHDILEPPVGTVVRSEDVRAWLVPGLAFTEGGGRLGYGGGWYDRLLARAAKSAPKIGVAYGFQLVDELPTEPHDIRLTSVESCEDLADIKPLVVPSDEIVRKSSFWTLRLGPDSRDGNAVHVQVTARPSTWGVGLWPSDEMEAVAKRCAEILAEAFQCEATNLIPSDTMGGIHRLDRYGDLDDVVALLQIEEEFKCEIPADKLQPEMTFEGFVNLVYSGRGKSVRSKRPRGPIRRFLGRACLWGVVAFFASLPVIVPLDLFRRYWGAQGHLTGFMIFEVFALAVMLCLLIDSRRDAPRKKRRQHWNALGEGE